MWRHCLLLTITSAQQLVYKYNVSCDNATNTLVKDERRDPATGEWVGEWVEPGGGWVPNYVRINLRARYIHEMGGDNSSKLAKQLCHEIGATIATIYSEEEDELAYAACKPADCWIGLEEDGGIPDFKCDGKCGTAETWWGEQVWLWVDDPSGPLGLINRRIGDGLVGYRWRAGGSNGLNMPEGYERWNRLQGQPDNGKLKGVPGDERHAHIAGYDGMWHDVLGTDEYYPLCRIWPNRSDGFVWNGTDCKPKATPSPTDYNVFLHDPEYVWGGFLVLVFHCLVLGLLFTLSKKVRDKRERTREHYYYSWRSMCASGCLCLYVPFPFYALLPLLTPCDKYNTAIVPEGGGGPESLMDDGKSTLAQYWSAFIEVIQACTWALGVPLKMAMSRTDFLATKYNDFGGGAYRAFVDLKLKKDERIKWLDAWGSIDTDTSNSVDAAEFFEAFRFEPNEYARKLYNIYDAKKNNSIPFHDFLITTWRLCHVSRESCEEVSFRLLRRSSRFNKLDSTLDVRDVQRFVEHRYGFKKASAKKKSLQIFQFIGPCPV